MNGRNHTKHTNLRNGTSHRKCIEGINCRTCRNEMAEIVEIVEKVETVVMVEFAFQRIQLQGYSIKPITFHWVLRFEYQIQIQ